MEAMRSIPPGYQLVSSIPSQTASEAVPPGFVAVNSVVAPSGPSDLSKLWAGTKGAVAAAATGGQDIYNTLRHATLGNALLPTVANIIPASHQNFYNTLNVPQYARNGITGDAEKVIQYLPTLVPSLESGEGESAIASGAWPKIKSMAHNTLNYFTPRAANVAQQAGIGGALSSNPTQGAESFGIGQGIVEGANPLLRTVMSPFHGVANLANPVNLAKSFGEGLRNVVSNVKGQVEKMYAPMHALGDNTLTDDPDSLIDPENEKLFPLKIRRKLNTFRANPTIENGHQLQSDMFTVGNKINPLTFADQDTKDALDNSRVPILNAISTRLNSLSPSAGDAYNQGRYIHATVLKKLTPTPFFDNIADGELDSENPEELVREYKKAFPLKSDHPNNYLTENIAHLKNRMGVGKALQYLGPMGIGAMMGHAGGGSLGDVIGGAAGGGAFARFEEAPIIKNLLQNEGLHNALGGLGKIGRKVSRVTIPVIASQSANSLNNIPQKNIQ
jgi:hypothetical protein